MPKTDDKTENGVDSEPKIYSASETKGLWDENARLKKQIRGLRGLEGRRTVERTTNEPESTETKPEIPGKVHTFKPWQARCTDCGEENPGFRDETACANCGQHLGTVETAFHLEHCPNCGTVKVRALNEEAQKKVEALVENVKA